MNDQTPDAELPGDIRADQQVAAYAVMEISQVVTRACVRCGGKRDAEHPKTPCAGCGLDEPPVQHDNGIVSAAYKDPERQTLWQTAGKHLAAQRIAAANLYHQIVKE